jgi:uncharacterized protein YlxP (DUF503 family)
MTVATLRLDLRLGPGLSPREARRQMQTIMDKLHRHFNVSVASTEGDGGHDVAVLIAAAAARTRRDARETLERVAEAVAAHPRAEVLSLQITEV